MNIFATTLKYAAFFGAREPTPDHPSQFNVRNVTILVIFGLDFLWVTSYLVFDADTFRDYTVCFFPWLTLLCVWFGFFVMVYISPALFKILRRVTVLVENQSQDPISRCLMEDTHTKIELWTQILYTFCLKVIVPIGAVPLYAASYILYYTTDMGADSFIIPTDLKLPWNNRTPIGYFFGGGLQIASFLLILSTVMLAFGMIVGFFGFGVSFSSDIRRRFYQLCENYKIEKSPTKFTKDFGDLLQLTMEIKDMVEEYTELNKNVVTLFYGWSLIAICDSLLMCKVADNFTDLLLPILLTFAAFAPIFLFCELGERISTAADNVYVEILQSLWYTFPIGVRKILPMVYMGMQKTIALEGFGNIICTREAFKNVTSSGYRYFTAFKDI